MKIKLIKVLAIQANHLPNIIARTLLLLSCTTIFGFSPNSLTSQNPKITINHDRKVTIYEVFEIIGKQTECTFIYQSDIFKDVPPIKLKKGTTNVNDLLKQCLPPTSFNITTTKDNHITITRRISKALPQGNIKGVVTDSLGMGMAGVNIVIKNTSKGTQTNLDGEYTIIAHPSDTLVFTYMGYKPQEIAIGNRTLINVVMQSDATALDQVVINAGYYKVTDREKTGTINTVSSKEIEDQIISNPLAALQGRVSGLQIVQSSGTAGSGFKVRIRGQNSLVAGNNPLYIIDGVPYNSQSLGSENVSGLALFNGDFSPFSFLNPSDIESIEILKDADATAIYGSRGANGVILITTKGNSSSGLKFVFTSKTNVGQVSTKQKLLNTKQYLQMREIAFANDGIIDYPIYEYDINGTWDPNRYTDWQKELIGGTAFSQDYQVSVSGGNTNTTFSIGGGFHKESTVFPEDDHYIKVNGLAKINYQSPNENFKFNLSTIYAYEKNELPDADLSLQALTLPPNAPSLYLEDGSLNWENGTFNNPLGPLEGESQTTKNSMLINSNLQLKLINNLLLKVNLGLQEVKLSEFRTLPHTRFPPSYGLTSKASSIFTNQGDRSSWIIEPQLNYSHLSEKSGWNFLIGITAQDEKTTNLGHFAQGFSTNAQIMNLAAAERIRISEDSERNYKYLAVYGRINFNYLKKYLLNLTGRRDGSSRFGPNNRFANFGAVGAAWIFSEEPSVQKFIPFLSYGKFRGSYGVTGNDQIGDYQYLNSYNSSGTNYNGTITLYPTALYNPDFEWEKNQKRELALELGFIKNRIKININHYRNRSSNQLLRVPMPGTTGFDNILSNLDAVVENRGWEFEIATINLNRDNWNWTTSFNITLPKNELVAFPNLENSTYANSYVIGEPITIHKVLHFTGVDPQTGIYGFEDFNGDGQISDPEDSQKIIDTAPRYYGGMSNVIKIGNFECDLFFQFSKQVAQNINYFGVTPGTMFNQPLSALDAWSAPGDQSSTQAYTSGQNYNSIIAAYYYGQSDAAYSDASFVRLKNLSISYNLRNIISTHSTTKFFIQSQNVFTWTSFKGVDPEQTLGFIPALRWFGAGATLTF